MAFVPTALVSFRLRTHESSTQNLFARRQRVFEAVKKPRSRISRRVTCDIDNKPPSSDVEVESRDGKDASESPIAKLRSEQLDAYFDADESMYQVRLANALSLAFKNFAVELRELQIGFRRFLGMRPPLRYTPPECLGFTLDNEAVTLREKTRESRDGRVQTSWFVRMFYDVTCKALDVFFDGRPVPRFWFLETVARMPYFSYSSCLHLLSTLGWYRSPTLMNMHHAEELNEAYHLAVMESLGGDKRWGDRFLAFHASIVYYWLLVFLFFISPAESYRFSQILEAHAVDTYGEFLDANKELLRSLPVPDVAYEYFGEFRYYFYEFQLSRDEHSDGKRRPEISSLFDVFENILMDEEEHCQTMSACTDFIVKGDAFSYNGKVVSGSSRRPNILPSQKREAFWRQWSKMDEDDVDI